jgi:hypothetical protein
MIRYRKAKVLFPLNNQRARTQDEAEKRKAKVLEIKRMSSKDIPMPALFLIERRNRYVGRKKDELYGSVYSLCLF